MQPPPIPIRGKGSTKRTVLIVVGFSNHHWQLNTQVIRDTLETNGSFAIDVTTSPPTTDTRWPIEWTVHYGTGRVYNSTYGHVWHDDDRIPARTRCAAVQTLMARALFWLANREPMPPVPADFPTAERMSIR